jgi:hypothetical protein
VAFDGRESVQLLGVSQVPYSGPGLCRTENYAFYGLGEEPKPEPELVKSWNQNRKKLSRFRNTALNIELKQVSKLIHTLFFSAPG